MKKPSSGPASFEQAGSVGEVLGRGDTAPNEIPIHGSSTHERF